VVAVLVVVVVVVLVFCVSSFVCCSSSSSVSTLPSKEYILVEDNPAKKPIMYTMKISITKMVNAFSSPSGTGFMKIRETTAVMNIITSHVM